MAISISPHALLRLKQRFNWEIPAVLKSLEKELHSFWNLGRNGRFKISATLNGRKIVFIVAEQQLGQKFCIITVY
jgi:hypothetical protein